MTDTEAKLADDYLACANALVDLTDETTITPEVANTMYQAAAYLRQCAAHTTARAQPASAMHQQLLDTLGAKDQADAMRIIAKYHAWELRTQPADLPDVPELTKKLGIPDAVFDGWRNRQDDKSWVRLDLSALRVGYEFGKAAAPQPKAKGGWRPIETAPCDGRFALVYRPLADMSGDKCIAIKRLVGGNNFCWPQTVPDGSTPTNPTADGACHVTHWMPLPEPPENG